MPINFSTDQWTKIKQDYTAWWSGDLKRPLLHITSYGHDPKRNPPKQPWLHFLPGYGLDTPVSEILDAREYGLCSQQYLGDAFPSIWLDFGPGSVAAYIGAMLESRNETVWFHPKEPKAIEELDFSYDPDSAWLNRAKDIGREATQRWQGLVQVGMADLGGTLDILSTFRPGDQLLTDLYLNPEHVKRLSSQINKLWLRYFKDIDSVFRPLNPGYTSWTTIFSKDPYYMLQCDFAYMIGPDMFDEFVKPDLTESCKNLTNPFYHLDGVGQLPHLDSLLSIKELKGVQWVPGDGKPAWYTWIDVYKRIRDAGKLIQVYGSMKDVDRFINELGSGAGIIAIISIDKSEDALAQELIARHS